MLKAIFSFILTAALGSSSYMLSLAAEDRPELTVLQTASQVGFIITVLLLMISIYLFSSSGGDRG